MPLKAYWQCAMAMAAIACQCHAGWQQESEPASEEEEGESSCENVLARVLDDIYKANLVAVRRANNLDPKPDDEGVFFEFLVVSIHWICFGWNFWPTIIVSTQGLNQADNYDSRRIALYFAEYPTEGWVNTVSYMPSLRGTTPKVWQPPMKDWPPPPRTPTTNRF